MKALSEYLIESSKKYDTKKAKTALEIETAINNGDFVVTSDCEFECPKLSDVDLEDLEEAIKQYWDDAGIEWLKLTRKNSKFKIATTKMSDKTPEEDKKKKKPAFPTPPVPPKSGEEKK